MKVKVKKLHDNAVIPQYAKEGDAGFDLIAVSVKERVTEGQLVYGTGLAFEIPAGYVGLIFPRSSVRDIGFRLANCVGVIDSGYRGEVMATFDPSSIFVGGILNEDSMMEDCFDLYEVGDKVAQMVIMPFERVELMESEELSETDRGEGGHGSTGK